MNDTPLIYTGTGGGMTASGGGGNGSLSGGMGGDPASGGNNFNWSNLIAASGTFLGGVGQVIGGINGAHNNTTNTNQTNPINPNTNTNSNNQNTPPATNWALYIGIGAVVLLVLGFMLFMIFRNRKAKPTAAL